MKHLRVISQDRARTGGWFCYGECQRFTELNMDREQNVCVSCGRPTVTFLPPAQVGPESVERESVEREALQVEANARRPRREAPAVEAERARSLFEQMRAVVERAEQEKATIANK